MPLLGIKPVAKGGIPAAAPPAGSRGRRAAPSATGPKGRGLSKGKGLVPPPPAAAAAPTEQAISASHLLSLLGPSNGPELKHLFSSGADERSSHPAHHQQRGEEMATGIPPGRPSQQQQHSYHHQQPQYGAQPSEGHYPPPSAAHYPPTHGAYPPYEATLDPYSHHHAPLPPPPAPAAPAPTAESNLSPVAKNRARAMGSTIFGGPADDMPSSSITGHFRGRVNQGANATSVVAAALGHTQQQQQQQSYGNGMAGGYEAGGGGGSGDYLSTSSILHRDPTRRQQPLHAPPVHYPHQAPPTRGGPDASYYSRQHSQYPGQYEGGDAYPSPPSPQPHSHHPHDPYSSTAATALPAPHSPRARRVGSEFFGADAGGGVDHVSGVHGDTSRPLPGCDSIQSHHSGAYPHHHHTSYTPPRSPPLHHHLRSHGGAPPLPPPHPSAAPAGGPVPRHSWGGGDVSTIETGTSAARQAQRRKQEEMKAILDEQIAMKQAAAAAAGIDSVGGKKSTKYAQRHRERQQELMLEQQRAQQQQQQPPGMPPPSAAPYGYPPPTSQPSSHGYPGGAPYGQPPPSHPHAHGGYPPYGAPPPGLSSPPPAAGPPSHSRIRSDLHVGGSPEQLSEKQRAQLELRRQLAEQVREKEEKKAAEKRAKEEEERRDMERFGMLAPSAPAPSGRARVPPPQQDGSGHGALPPGHPPAGHQMDIPGLEGYHGGVGAHAGPHSPLSHRSHHSYGGGGAAQAHSPGGSTLSPSKVSENRSRAMASSVFTGDGMTEAEKKAKERAMAQAAIAEQIAEKKRQKEAAAAREAELERLDELRIERDRMELNARMQGVDPITAAEKAQQFVQEKEEERASARRPHQQQQQQHHSPHQPPSGPQSPSHAKTQVAVRQQVHVDDEDGGEDDGDYGGGHHHAHHHPHYTLEEDDSAEEENIARLTALTSAMNEKVANRRALAQHFEDSGLIEAERSGVHLDEWEDLPRKREGVVALGGRAGVRRAGVKPGPSSRRVMNKKAPPPTHPGQPAATTATGARRARSAARNGSLRDQQSNSAAASRGNSAVPRRRKSAASREREREAEVLAAVEKRKQRILERARREAAAAGYDESAHSSARASSGRTRKVSAGGSVGAPSRVGRRGRGMYDDAPDEEVEAALEAYSRSAPRQASRSRTRTNAATGNKTQGIAAVGGGGGGARGTSLSRPKQSATTLGGRRYQEEEEEEGEDDGQEQYYREEEDRPLPTHSRSRRSHQEQQQRSPPQQPHSPLGATRIPQPRVQSGKKRHPLQDGHAGHQDPAPPLHQQYSPTQQRQQQQEMDEEGSHEGSHYLSPQQQARSQRAHQQQQQQQPYSTSDFHPYHDSSSHINLNSPLSRFTNSFAIQGAPQQQQQQMARPPSSSSQPPWFARADAAGVALDASLSGNSAFILLPSSSSSHPISSSHLHPSVAGGNRHSLSPSGSLAQLPSSSTALDADDEGIPSDELAKLMTDGASPPGQQTVSLDQVFNNDLLPASFRLGTDSQPQRALQPVLSARASLFAQARPPSSRPLSGQTAEMLVASSTAAAAARDSVGKTSQSARASMQGNMMAQVAEQGTHRARQAQEAKEEQTTAAAAASSNSTPRPPSQPLTNADLDGGDDYDADGFDALSADGQSLETASQEWLAGSVMPAEGSNTLPPPSFTSPPSDGNLSPQPMQHNPHRRSSLGRPMPRVKDPFSQLHWEEENTK